MSRSKGWWIAGLVGLGGLGFAVYFYGAASDPMFRVREVRVGGLPEGGPVTRQDIVDLAAIQEGKESLFSIRLGQVRERILANDWVREATIQKIFPNRLEIEVILREPLAVYQHPDGELSFIDARGALFGRGDQAGALLDLPVVSGLKMDDRKELRQIARWLADWKQAEKTSALVSSASWVSEEGWRLMVVYPLPHQKELHRTIVRLGKTSASLAAKSLTQLKSVLSYLVSRGIPAHELQAVSDKKIVVNAGKRF